MKISFWIPAVVFSVVRAVFSNSVQVGTVLFTTTDIVKKCWTESDKSLLKARLIMQDVLPQPDCIDFSNPEAVAILLDYFHACYKIISTSAYGKLQNLMYLALSDALGGYLRAYVLPYTRRAYYAGQIKYSEAKKLFQLYDDIRVFLKTNGVGWAEPQKICLKNFHVRPLVITGGTLEACKELYVIEKKGRLHCMNTKSNAGNSELVRTEKPRYIPKGFPESPERFTYKQKNPKSKKSRLKSLQKERRFAKDEDTLGFYNLINSSSGGHRFFKNLTKDRTLRWLKKREMSEVDPCLADQLAEKNTSSSGNMKRVIVPLPILDDPLTPHSIAVPLLKQPLRNLQTGCSAFILEYYYLAVVRCFIAKGNSRSDIKNFNAQFHSWLVSQVVPRLFDEQWYPGFGGVLRVLQTIKKFGVENSGNDPTMHDIAFLFNEGVEFETENKGKTKVREVAGDEEEPMICDSINSERHILTTIIIVSMIWLFIFCAFAFYCQATRGHRLLYEGHPTTPTTTNQKKDDNSLNFHFFVRFFKNRSNQPPEDYSLKIAKIGDTRRVMPVAEYRPRCTHGRPTHYRDSFAYFNSLISSVFPSQPYLGSFDKVRPQKLKKVREFKFPDKGQGDQLQMLWKKSSHTFKKCIPSQEGRELSMKKTYDSTLSPTISDDLHGRSTTYSCSVCQDGNTKCYNTEKLTSTCYCSESCPFAHTTSNTTTTYQRGSKSMPSPTTNTTTTTQVAEKLSSATMEFFEEVIAKHKSKKPSTLDSTAESESECSTTSETDY